MKFQQENFFFTDYRSGWLDAIAKIVMLAFLMLGLGPKLFDHGDEVLACCSIVLGWVSAAAVYCFFEQVVVQGRALSFEDRRVVEFIYFKKWLPWRRLVALADFDDIAFVYVDQKLDLTSRYHNYYYPVILLTQDGRKIPMGNRSETINRESHSLPLARELAKILGCRVVYSQEPAPLKVVRKGSQFALQVK